MIMAQHPQSQQLSQRHHQQSTPKQQTTTSQYDADSNGERCFRDKLPAQSTQKLQQSRQMRSLASNHLGVDGERMSAPETAPIKAIFGQQPINDNKSKLQKQSSIHRSHLDNGSENKYYQEGKRSLIKNQLFLIEQLQLENANLRNERDQLQLENEELKFQLQMISSSNILIQPEGTFADNHRHQFNKLVDRTDGPSAAVLASSGTGATVTNNCASQVVAPVRFRSASSASNNSQRGSSAVVTSASGLAQITATPVRQPMRSLNGLFADDQLRPSHLAENNSPSCRRATSSSELATSQTAQPLVAANTTLASNELREQQASNAPETNQNKFLGAKSSSLASFTVTGSSLTKALPGSANLQANLRSSPAVALDANQEGDETERALLLICQRLDASDSETVVSAAVIIQRAFRKYQICKRFRVITEQLRHACKTSSSSTGPQQATTASSGLSAPFASGTTRAAALESLSQAASRLAASAAAKQAAMQQQKRLVPAVTKSASSQQVNRPDTNSFIECKFQSHLRGSGAIQNQLTIETSRQISSSAGSNGSASTGAAAGGGGQMKSPDVVAALNLQQLEALRKRQYRVGLNIFNKSPEKGISFLVAYSFIDCSSPFAKSSTSYYLANQLHLIDKQHLAQQHTIQAHQQSQQDTTINLRQGAHLSTCQSCIEEESLKRNVAHFLLHRKGLAKEKIGQYLGDLQSQFNQDVLRCYLQELDFSGLQIDVALRKFCSTLRMPGEAQKIERFVDYFAERYVQCQQQQAQIARNASGSNLAHQAATLATNHNTPLKSLSTATRAFASKESSVTNAKANNNSSNLTLLSRDEIFILTFAIIMLNTDLHSPSLKSQARMSGQQFIHNLRGVFKSQTINESDLLEIYERVKANQITTTPDHVTHVLKVQQGLTVNNFQKKDTIPKLCIPHRRLVCFCRLFEVYDVNKKERAGQHQREIFLFNDLLLVTKLARRARANTPQQYTYRQSIPLHGIYVQLFQSTHYNFGIRLCRRSNDETLVMFNARQELDQSRFVDDLSESIAEMEEMEALRAHNFIDTIHFKQQERLRRHAMMHEMQTTDNQGTQFIETTTNGKLARGLSIMSFEIQNGNNKAVSNEKLVISKDKNEEQHDIETKENVASSAGLSNSRNKPRRLQSKFSSMSNLSSVSEGRDNEEENNCRNGDNNSDGANDAAVAQLSKPTANSNKARMNRSLVQLFGKQAADGEPSTQRRHKQQRTYEPIQQSSRLDRNQRSCSTVSVHSLDSGLFLSRDASPNQSG